MSDDREALARVLDPHAWQMLDRGWPDDADTEPSLDAADRIIAAGWRLNRGADMSDGQGTDPMSDVTEIWSDAERIARDAYLAGFRAAKEMAATLLSNRSHRLEYHFAGDPPAPDSREELRNAANAIRAIPDPTPPVAQPAPAPADAAQGNWVARVFRPLPPEEAAMLDIYGVGSDAPAPAPADAPGHTDLMVAPESIGPWLEANPLAGASVLERARQAAGQFAAEPSSSVFGIYVNERWLFARAFIATQAALEAAQRERDEHRSIADELRGWRDTAVVSCAKRRCSTMQRDRDDAETRAEAAEQRVQQMEAALREYGQHKGMCHTKGGRDCTCDWDQARAALGRGGDHG